MQMDNSKMISNVERWKKKAGKADYLKHLSGGRLTQRQAIRGMCFSCDPESNNVCTLMHCTLQPFNALIHKNIASGNVCATPDSE